MATALADVHVKVNQDIKKESEVILDKIGISMSDLINMTLRQLIYQKRIPFDTALEYEMPECMNIRTEEELIGYIKKGIEKDKKNPKRYSQAEVEKLFHVGSKGIAA